MSKLHRQWHRQSGPEMVWETFVSGYALQIRRVVSDRMDYHGTVRRLDTKAKVMEGVYGSLARAKQTLESYANKHE